MGQMHRHRLSFRVKTQEQHRHKQEARKAGKTYLWKAFFVNMIHHDNLIVKCSTGSSRAELEAGKKKTKEGKSIRITLGDFVQI